MNNNMIFYFENTVEQNSEKICVIDEDASLSFRQLKEQSLNVANAILSRAKDAKYKPIAVILPKCKEIYVADIGITYSGNIFMNLDVKTPVARLNNILETIDPIMLITNHTYLDLAKKIGADKNIEIVDIDDIFSSESVDTTKIYEKLRTMIDTDPFCIINTSGSTGTPKGVVLNHRSFVDFTSWSIEKFGFDGRERIGALSPVVFDIYEYEMCLMMTKGSTIVLLDGGMAVFPAKLLSYVQEMQVNFLFWVPSIMVNIANMNLLEKIPLPEMQTIWFAGEVFPTKQFNYWKKQLPNVVFANLYGPIEITLDCTYYIVEREFQDSEPLPIGTPCENTDILILNEQDQLCENGEVGELCVRGTSLAMGYYNNPEKTRMAFVQNPLNSSYPELIYRTGDLVYVNQQNEIVFKGRKDSLIKHMGYRIELSEIEHILIDTLKLISYGCVVYQYEKKEVTLFYEKKNDITQKDIRKELAKMIPRYMIPTVFVEMDELPRNTNGKIDRLKLSKMANEEEV